MGETDPAAIRASGRAVVLINNAIHPGEPAGVDASMMLARDLVQDPVCKVWLQDVVVVIIPYYNVDGGRNRSATYRANQSGPREQGFRGNARNLDLNRDFIKCDSRNARTFSRVFHHWDPDVFVDTHTSNGADYPYTITVIPTQPDKLPPALAQYQEERLLPWLYQHMEQVGWPMCPYVHSDGPPDRGILGFLDLPRYSTGYTALFQTIGFMPETHMLKPFADRVRSTRAFLDGVLSIVAAQRTALLAARRMARNEVREQICWPLHWTLDTSRTESLPFHGYSAEMVRSQVHGQPRLRYDREKTYHQEIPYLPHYRPTLTVDRPWGYVLPRAWDAVVERCQLNGITMYVWPVDTLLEVTVSTIRDWQTAKRPYEGHYPHYGTLLEQRTERVPVYAGDLIVPVDQPGIAYIMATFEPEAADSWFSWNFFDAVLQRKEYFSSYVFEDLAADLLAKDPALSDAFRAARKRHPEWKENPRAALQWIYERSPYSEPTYQRYPILRLEQSLEIPD